MLTSQLVVVVARRRLGLFTFVRTKSTTTNNTNEHDFFSIMQLPHNFDIDQSLLKQNYRNLMAQHHPDKQQQYMNNNNNNGNNSDQMASKVTLAYDTLKNHHSRATHLLEIKGRPMDSEETTNGSGGIVSPDFLFEIMSIREDIQACRSDNKQLQKYMDENDARVDETYAELVKAFKANDMDRAIELTAKLQYWNRIDETIKDQMT